MAKTTLPSLHSNDGRSGSDDAQRQRIAQAKANAIVNLEHPYQLPFAKQAQSTHTSVCHWCVSMPLGSGYQNG